MKQRPSNKPNTALKKRWRPLWIISVLASFQGIKAHEHASDRLHSQNAVMGERLYSEQTITAPELSLPGAFQAGVTTISIDGPNLLQAEAKAKAGRSLKLEVWYPSEGSGKGASVYENVTRGNHKFALQGRAIRDADTLKQTSTFPLVVLSHGYTGYRTIMFYLGEHLASHGYVVVGIDHTDSTNEEIDFVNAGGAGFPSTLLHRSRDQQAVLAHFKKNHSFGVDSRNASVIGYSMGGYGALATSGACYNFDQAKAQALGIPEAAFKANEALLSPCLTPKNIESDWKAMVAIAPWGGEQAVFDQLNEIKLPSLFIAGEHDDVSGYENGVKKLYDQTGAEDKYLLVYENARHNIGPHPAPAAANVNDLALGHYFEPAWNIETINRINQHMVLAFLNCHIKNTKCDMLPTRESVTQTKTTDGKLTPPWPGFKDRWGAGVKFMRGKSVEN